MLVAVALSRQTLVASGLLGAALVAWIVTVDRMRGMDAGPGTDLGGLGWYVGIWVTMMAAMMLPSAAPMVLVHARLGRGSTVLFVAGYLVAWTVYGLAAYGVYRGIRASAPAFLGWDRGGPWVAGGALIAAGLYQLTPLKTVCLRHCRTPMGFLHGHAGDGPVRAGVMHGAWCIGCCGGLMLALFALGVMSLVWMAVVALVILVEKALPGGNRLVGVTAGALILLGIWTGVSPGSVPGLTQPHPMHMMHG
jgi:predicted metal-binding membrane protein